MTEDQLQSKCFIWAWNTYPALRYCFWHVPNGKQRNIVEAVQLKSMGVVAGVHDMHVFWQSQLYIMEFKVGTNKLTESQERFKKSMTLQGAIFYEIRDFETWSKIITTIATVH